MLLPLESFSFRDLERMAWLSCPKRGKHWNETLSPTISASSSQSLVGLTRESSPGISNINGFHYFCIVFQCGQWHAA